MATYETKGRLTYKDENSDNHIIYPVTKMDCIEDMPDIETEIAESVAAYLEDNPVETPDITDQVSRAETAADEAEKAASDALGYKNSASNAATAATNAVDRASGFATNASIYASRAEEAATRAEEAVARVPEDGGGTVKTVNGVEPDENGNVEITIPDSGGNVDLTGYATEQFVRDGYQPKGNYLTEHQDISGKLDANKLPEAINDALAQAKASGEFDGADGKDGKDGKDGTDGQDGYTPQKGVDYNDGADGKSAYAYAQEGGYTGTEAEFAEKLAQEIPTALPNPHALTINGTAYDGSTAVELDARFFEVTITDNGDGSYTSSHTYSEIKKAYDRGRIPVAAMGTRRYVLSLIGNTIVRYSEFIRQEDKVLYTIRVLDNDVKVHTTTMATPEDIPDINQEPFFLLLDVVVNDDGSVPVAGWLDGKTVELGTDLTACYNAYLQGRTVFVKDSYDDPESSPLMGTVLPCTWCDGEQATFSLAMEGATMEVFVAEGVANVMFYEPPVNLPNPNALTVNGISYDGSEEINVKTSLCVTITDNGDGYGNASIPYEQIVSAVDAGTDVYCSMLSESGFGNLQMRLTYYDPNAHSILFEGDDFLLTTRKVVFFVGGTEVQILNFPLGKLVVVVTDNGDGTYSIDKTLEELAGVFATTPMYAQVVINDAPTMVPLVCGHGENGFYQFEGISNSTFIKVQILGGIIAVYFEDFDEKVNTLIDTKLNAIGVAEEMTF